MSARGLNATPSAGAVFREHLATVREGNSLEVVLLAIGAIVFTAFPYVYRSVYETSGPSGFNLSPTDFGIGAVFMALLAPLAVWRSDALSRRSYLLAMPVGRIRNQLMRLASGWVYLMVLLLLFFAWATLVSVLSHGEIGMSYQRVFTGQDIRTATPADFQMVTSRVPWWSWLTPITGATIAYLGVSALMIGARHPWRWIAGIWLVVMITGGLADGLQWEGVMRVFLALFGNHSWFGMATALTGTSETVVSLSEQGHAVHAERPDAGGWLASTTLWMSLAIAATAGAVSRHRES